MRYMEKVSCLWGIKENKTEWVGDKSKIEGYTEVLEEISGRTARVQVLTNGKEKIVKKTYKEDDKPFFESKKVLDTWECFQNEVSALKWLYGCSHFPKLLYYEEGTKTLYMNYVGVSLRVLRESKKRIEIKDWRQQVKSIYRTLKEKQIYNNDVHYNNFCLKDGKLTLIDYGFAKRHVDFCFKNFNERYINESRSLYEMCERIYEDSKVFFSVLMV